MTNLQATVGTTPSTGGSCSFGTHCRATLGPLPCFGSHRDIGCSQGSAATRATLLVIGLMLALVFTSLLFSSQPAHARQLCGERASILEQLAGRYSETPQSMGLAADGTVVEVLVSPSGSWTILVSHPNRLTCLAASGEHWEMLPKVAVGPSA